MIARFAQHADFCYVLLLLLLLLLLPVWQQWAADWQARKLPGNQLPFWPSAAARCDAAALDRSPVAPALTAPPLWCLRPPQSQFTRELREFNMYEDCPVFDGLFEYCQVWEEVWEQQWMGPAPYGQRVGWIVLCSSACPVQTAEGAASWASL